MRKNIIELKLDEIKNHIYTIRGKQVMLDRDLASLYDVSTKALNQAVKRNIERFPSDFMFQLTFPEKNELVTNCDLLKKLKYSSHLPYVFSEHGVTALSGVLKSKKAIKMNVQIIRTFIAMKKYVSSNAQVFHRLDRIE